MTTTAALTCLMAASICFCQCLPAFLQPLVGIDERHRATARLVELVREKCLDLGRSAYSIQEDTGLADKIARRLARERAAELKLAGPAEAPYCIGIDEAHLKIGTPCVVVDNVNSRVIDILELRNKTMVRNFLRGLPGWGNIRAVTIDMHAPYRDAIREALPDAAIVIDKFHDIDKAHRAVNAVRVRRRGEMTRGRRREVLRDRELLWKNREELTPQEREDLRAWLKAMPDLRRAYFLVKRFKLLWRAPSVEEALRRYERWRARVPAELLYAFEVLLTAMGNWKREVFNVIEFPFSNAFAERMNRDIKKIYGDGQGVSLEVVRAKMVSRVNKHPRRPSTRKGGMAQAKRSAPRGKTAADVSASVLARVYQPLLPYDQSDPV